MGIFLDKITDRQRTSLAGQWDKRSNSLMERDGTSEKHENGGHRIKQNPLLIRAIEEIRDGYFDLFLQKMPLVKQSDAKGLSEEEKNQINRCIEDLNYDLIVYNNQSFLRLQKPNYGFSDAEAEKILAGVARDSIERDLQGLASKDAAKIMGSIIKRSIDAFEITFAREGWQRPWVPHVPLIATPENVGRRRSMPAPAGDSGAQGRG